MSGKGLFLFLQDAGRRIETFNDMKLWKKELNRGKASFEQLLRVNRREFFKWPVVTKKMDVRIGAGMKFL